jgi:hypothetical protein
MAGWSATMGLAPACRRAASGFVTAFAAYGVARLAADVMRRRRPSPAPSSGPRRLVDDVAAPKEAPASVAATSADQAYYDWRDTSIAHTDDEQPPVDE